MKLKRKASASMPIKPVFVYEALSDYAAWSQWMPGVTGSTLLAREGNFAILELEFAAAPGKRLSVECIHVPNSAVIARSLSSSEPKIKIDWRMAPSESGETQITLNMEGPLSLGFLAGFGGFFKPSKGASALTGVVAGLGDGPAGEKIIEILETDEGLVCWYRGTRYRMEATS